MKARRCRGISEKMNSRSAPVPIKGVRCDRCYSSRLNPTRRVLSRGGVLGNIPSTVLTHFSHDDHRARQRHKHSQPRNARAGALVVHHLAWVGRHAGGSWSTPTVHPCMVRQEGCGWLNSMIHTHISSTTLFMSAFSFIFSHSFLTFFERSSYYSKNFFRSVFLLSFCFRFVSFDIICFSSFRLFFLNVSHLCDFHSLPLFLLSLSFCLCNLFLLFSLH